MLERSRDVGQIVQAWCIVHRMWMYSPHERLLTLIVSGTMVTQWKSRCLNTWWGDFTCVRDKFDAVVSDLIRQAYDWTCQRCGYVSTDGQMTGKD